MTRTKTTQLTLLGSLFLSATAMAQPAPAVEPEPTAESEALAAPELAEPEAEPAAIMEVDTTLSATADVEAMRTDVDSTNSWNFAVAPRIGLAVPTSKLSPFVAMGLELGYRLPAVDKRISVLVDVAYTRPSHGETANDPRVGGDADFETTESEIKLGLGGSFRVFTDDHTLVPWVGASAVMQRLTSTQTNDLAPGENTSEDTRFGGELFAGADYRLGPGYALGEARLVLTDLDDLITGNSNAGNVNLSLGYRLVF